MGESRTLTAQCGNCGSRLWVKTHLAEKVVACPKCNAQVKVSPVAISAREGKKSSTPWAATLSKSIFGRRWALNLIISLLASSCVGLAALAGRTGTLQGVRELDQLLLEDLIRATMIQDTGGKSRQSLQDAIARLQAPDLPHPYMRVAIWRGEATLAVNHELLRGKTFAGISALSQVDTRYQARDIGKDEAGIPWRVGYFRSEPGHSVSPWNPTLPIAQLLDPYSMEVRWNSVIRRAGPPFIITFVVMFVVFRGWDFRSESQSLRAARRIQELQRRLGQERARAEDLGRQVGRAGAAEEQTRRALALAKRDAAHLRDLLSEAEQREGENPSNVKDLRARLASETAKCNSLTRECDELKIETDQLRQDVIDAKTTEKDLRERLDREQSSTAAHRAENHQVWQNWFDADARARDAEVAIRDLEELLDRERSSPNAPHDWAQLDATIRAVGTMQKTVVEVHEDVRDDFEEYFPNDHKAIRILIDDVLRYMQMDLPQLQGQLEVLQDSEGLRHSKGAHGRVFLKTSSRDHVKILAYVSEKEWHSGHSGEQRVLLTCTKRAKRWQPWKPSQGTES